jgi:hypothetical protein
VRRLHPDAEDIYAGLGWRLPASIDRVYVNTRARSELGWEPVWDFRRTLDCLARGDAPRSRLAVEVGAKGYHEQPTGVYTTTARDETSRLRRSTWEYYDCRISVDGHRGGAHLGGELARLDGLGTASREEAQGSVEDLGPGRVGFCCHVCGSAITRLWSP